ncbi:hypothetical protein [Mycobacterium sp. 29Ha]|uniref:hypothetical protein n=1 Tax=Mycobacterium sp. 29Ha TaxID=2939268 RepID=UPI002938D6AF|nr:hypothetical protein [Mycobacterium sp. 29Ha]MDV3135718.1 hypothetical protein [Mycobacterium sp. 29Ha]
MSVDIALELNALQFNGFRFKLLPDQSISGNELLCAPTNELGMLGGGGRAGCRSIHVICTVVSHREVITDAEVVLLGFSDGFKHLRARGSDVLAAAPRDTGRFTMHIALQTRYRRISGHSVQRRVLGVTFPGRAARGQDVLPVLLDRRLQ